MALYSFIRWNDVRKVGVILTTHLFLVDYIQGIDFRLANVATMFMS